MNISPHSVARRDHGLSVAHRHEVSPAAMPGYEKHFLRILEVFETHQDVSQRSLAAELGIALGLTNLLVKRLTRKGWVRAVAIRPNRVRYLVTPAGIIEKARMSRAYFETSVQFYRETRDRIQERFLEVSADWRDVVGGKGPKGVVFYGAGEVAEIGYICLPATDLRLVGVVDESRTAPFFGLDVHPLDDLRGGRLGETVVERLVVMSFGRTEAIRARLRAAGVPAERTCWL